MPPTREARRPASGTDARHDDAVAVMDSDEITLTLSGSEAHALEAALTLYRSLLTSGLELGGDAREAALLMDPPALRVQTRLAGLMYGEEDLSLGDFYAWPIVGEVAS